MNISRFSITADCMMAYDPYMRHLDGKFPQLSWNPSWNLKESLSPSSSSRFPQTSNTRGHTTFFFFSLGRFVVKISRAWPMRDTNHLAGWETTTVFRNCVEFWSLSHFQQTSSAGPAGERDDACFFFSFVLVYLHQVSFHSLKTIMDVVKIHAAPCFFALVCP